MSCFTLHPHFDDTDNGLLATAPLSKTKLTIVRKDGVGAPRSGGGGGASVSYRPVSDMIETSS